MRRGACPGVWAPMPSGDGLLVRVRAPRGRLKANQIRGLSRVARAFGNGLVELTRRGNLQLRGASEAALPDLQAELLRLGLASATPARERQPVLTLCPLDGLDPRCPPLEPLAEALEGVLAQPELTRPLSDKFSVLLSGGSSLFDELAFDVSFEVSRARPGWALLRVAGQLLGACPEEQLARALRRLLVLLGATVSEHARMSQLLDAHGAALAGTLAALSEAALLEPAPQEPRWAAEYFGFQSLPCGGDTPHPDTGATHGWFGFELAFGSLEASDWDHVAELAEQFASAEVRLLPTRAVLLPSVRAEDAALLAQRARARRFRVEPSTQRLVACSGAPACRSAHGETRQLALELAAILAGVLPPNEPMTLHVSGCEKSCAWSGPAHLTLLHGADGCRLGFGASVTETARTAPLDAAAVRQHVAAHFSAARADNSNAAQLQHAGGSPL